MIFNEAKCEKLISEHMEGALKGGVDGNSNAIQLEPLPSIDCGELVLFIPPQNYRRVKPTIRGPREDWMQPIAALKQEENVIPPAFHAVNIKNATVHGPGVITIPGNVVLMESLQNCDHDSAFGDITIEHTTHRIFLKDGPKPEYKSGKYIILMMQWDSNYGHWLIECLPRLIIFKKNFPISDYKVVISGASGRMDQVYIDSLNYIGIESAQILVTHYETMTFEEIIYPTPLTIQPWTKSPLVITALEELRNQVTCGLSHDQPERIFIERPSSSRRQLLNQSEIISKISQFDFIIVNPSKMSLKEQITVFSNAKIVVGVLGAECTNIVFSPPGIKLVGLSPHAMQDDFFWDLVSHKEGEYISLHSAGSVDDQGMNSPFTIDFEEILSSI